MDTKPLSDDQLEQLREACERASKWGSFYREVEIPTVLTLIEMVKQQKEEIGRLTESRNRLVNSWREEGI